MMALPPECQAIQDNIEGLEQERRSEQEELQQAAPGQKPSIIQRIRAINRQIVALEDQLAQCIATTPPPPPPPPPLSATFTGTASITTTFSQAPGPFTQSVQFGLFFDGFRTFISITGFPAITTAPFSTPFGSNTTTVTKIGGGSGSYASGNIVMPITLRFDQSLDLPFFEEDSTLGLVLTTNSPGSPVNAGGNVSLVGSGTFQDGVLGGSTGNLTIAGTISPVP
jgi:hypothetical protein